MMMPSLCWVSDDEEVCKVCQDLSCCYGKWTTTNYHGWDLIWEGGCCIPFCNKHTPLCTSRTLKDNWFESQTGQTHLHQVIMWLSAFRTSFLVYSTIIYVPDHCHVFGLCWEQVVDACIRLCATHGVPYPTADALLAIGYVCKIGISVIWAW